MRFHQEAKLADIDIGSHQRCHIMVALPTLGMVPIEFVVAFGRMQMPINGQCFQHIVKGFEVGMARNLCCEYIMKMDPADRPKWLFFIGDDMIPEYDAFVRLYEEAMKNDWDCLTGLYYWKGEPPTPLVWRNDNIGRMIPGVHFQSGEVVEVDLTGVDFTLIRTSLIEKMGDPWFKTGPSIRGNVPGQVLKYTGANNDSIIMHTEDVWFYGKAREFGAKIGVDTSVRVGHFDNKTGCIY